MYQLREIIAPSLRSGTDLLPDRYAERVIIVGNLANLTAFHLYYADMNTLFETQITHLTWPELEAGLDHIRQSPKDNGLLELIVCRPSVEERKVLEFGELDVQRGLIGDNWSTRGSSSTVDGGPNPEMQINIMNARAVALVAQQRERWHLAGDQLFLDMDLSKDNLPVGSRFSLGSAILEVTPPPHTGCSKFVARFGLEAMKFVNSEIGRSLCLRGINAKIVQSGSVEVGQLAKKI